MIAFRASAARRAPVMSLAIRAMPTTAPVWSRTADLLTLTWMVCPSRRVRPAS
jgi:hypothetical protein